jgi:hypothetical protein
MRKTTERLSLDSGSPGRDSNVELQSTKHKSHQMRLQVLMATRLKTVVFWGVAPSSLVETDWRFRGAYCLHHQGDEY